MNARWLIVVIWVAMLSGCASGPAYRPAPRPDDYGYRDTMLTNQRFRVSFSGDYGTARETVENFALFRAADVALSHGHKRFRITSRETSPVTSYTGGGPVGGFGYGWGYPFFGTAIGYSAGGYSRTRYETVLQIQVGPDVPGQGPDVYDADQVKRNLSSAVAGPRG